MIRHFDTPDFKWRVETGPTQFGNDWPGVFIRGDDSHQLKLSLEKILSLLNTEQQKSLRFEISNIQDILEHINAANNYP